MRLLHAIHSMNPANGGTTEAVRILVRHVPARHEIATLDRPGDPWVGALAEHTHPLGPGRGSYGFSARCRDWLRHHARDYDALIVHGLWQYHGPAVRDAARRAGVPYFVYPHGMLDPWFKKAGRLKHWKKSLVWPLADYRVLRDARAVFFTAGEEALLARDSFFPYRCAERVVGLGIAAPAGDPADLRERFLSRFPELRDRRRLLFLGRIDPKKGIDLLIRAFARTEPSWTLVLAGPPTGPGYHRAMQELARNLAAPGAVVWTGMLEGPEKWGALHAAEAFALPSHQENFGIAVAEALACGTPVLISDKVNIWREIEGDGAGFVGGDNEAGVDGLLERWLAADESERARMRRNARDSFARRFEIGRASAALLDTLKAAGVAA